MYVWIPNEVRIWGARRFYFVWALLFRDNVQTHLGGASIREGASNRDITVCGLSEAGTQDCRGDHLWRTVDRSLPRLTGAFLRAWLRLRHGEFWGCAPAPLTKLDLIDWLIDWNLGKILLWSGKFQILFWRQIILQWCEGRRSDFNLRKDVHQEAMVSFVSILMKIEAIIVRLECIWSVRVWFYICGNLHKRIPLNRCGPKIFVNIGSGKGLLHDATKPLPEPLMLTYYQWVLWHSPEGNFTGKCSRYLSCWTPKLYPVTIIFFSWKQRHRMLAL